MVLAGEARRVNRDVLLLLSSEDACRELREALSGAGVSVHIATSGVEALRIVRESPIRLALLETNDQNDRKRVREDILQLRNECRVAIVHGLEYAKSRGNIFQFGAMHLIVDGRELAELLTG